MHCGSCVGRVEAALTAVPGVSRVAANLATRQATIAYEGPADLQAVARGLDAAGYPVAGTRTVLDIQGLHCASCVGLVERALEAVPGVLAVRVNLASETASVRHLESSPPSASLVQAIEQAGYDAAVRDMAAAPSFREGETASLRMLALIAAILTAPVFAVEMGGHFFPELRNWIGAAIGHQASHVLQFALASAVIFGPGLRFLATGFPALFRGRPDMNALVALGTSAAWSYSTVATFAPGLLPEQSRAVYFESAAVIVTLILLGRWLEARAKGQTGEAIRHLAGLRPETARIRREDAFVEAAVESVAVGDLIQVRPGERIAVDGLVVEGRSLVDEAMISGEPLPVAKEAGSAVTGGTMNGNGALVFRATAVGRDTMLAGIIRMVGEAQGAKLPIQALVDRVTMRFVPAVLGIAAITVAAWLAFGPDPAHALVAGVAVLIVACPCAMGLATPTSVMVAMGRAAELGVLFRKGDALQKMAGIRAVAFDKTGTLTEGRPAVTGIELAEGMDKADVLAAAAALESASEHPLAEAIVEAAEREGAPAVKAGRFEAVAGLGVRGNAGERDVLVGSARLLADSGIDAGALDAAADSFANEGKTPVFAAIAGKAAAVMGISDPLKADAAGAVAALEAADLEIAMITGDRRATAEAVGAQLGIARILAEVLPSGKAKAISGLRRLGPVAFVGDGINDAPALAAADVGIAIGSGSDIAIEAAEVVLVSPSPAGVIRARRISQAAMANIRQNLAWAFGYNILLIPVAAGALYPAFGILLSPMLAAGAMALSSLAVVSNALRLRRSVPLDGRDDRIFRR